MKKVYVENNGVNSWPTNKEFFDKFGNQELRWSFDISRNYMSSSLTVYCNGEIVVTFNFGKREVKQVMKMLKDK